MSSIAGIKESLDSELLLHTGIENGFFVLCLTISLVLLPLFYLVFLSKGTVKTLSNSFLSNEGKVHRKDKNENAYLLIGCSGSGKTSLFHKLIGSKISGTVTSMMENRIDNVVFQSKSASKNGNTQDASPDSKTISLIDIPGHERLRFLWKKVLKTSNVKGIIFLIEAPNFSVKAARSVAEYLYSILTSPYMDNGPPILLCCHKSDLPTARKLNSIQKLITSELEKLRKLRERNTLQSVNNTRYGERQIFDENEDEENDSLPLGKANQPLQLERDGPCPIQFVMTSLINYEAIEQFIILN